MREERRMSEPVSRTTVEAFYQAYSSRDPERIGAMVDDNVEWYVGGPADVMVVCGSWRGKKAVIDRFRQVPKVIQFRTLEIESLLVDGDTSAMFGRVSSIHRASGRLICHRASHLVRYRDGKVIYFRVINDSLDAAEQFVGHRIDLMSDPDGGMGDLIAV
jgi:ketosteroid isomerase-like protein